MRPSSHWSITQVWILATASLRCWKRFGFLISFLGAASLPTGASLLHRAVQKRGKNYCAATRKCLQQFISRFDAFFWPGSRLKRALGPWHVYCKYLAIYFMVINIQNKQGCAVRSICKCDGLGEGSFSGLL